jgi:hypothetical protein
MKFRKIVTLGSVGVFLALFGCNSNNKDGSADRQQLADSAACPNSISLSPAGLSAIPDTYPGDGKPGVFQLDRIEYRVSGSNLAGTSSTVAKFVESIDPDAGTGVTGSVETECYSGSPNGKFDMNLAMPLEISRKEMKVLGISDSFSYENKNVTAHTLKVEDARDFYDYINTSMQLSTDNVERKAYQPSDSELEIVFHSKQGFGSGEITALAHYTYDPGLELN